MKSISYICVFLSIVIFILLIHIIFTGDHPLYDGISMTYCFLASACISLISFKRSIVVKLISILVSAFMTQRVIVTYIFPEEFDFNEFVRFTHAQIQYSTSFFFLCTLSMLIGVVIFSLIFKNNQRNKNSIQNPELYSQAKSISYFGLNVNFETLIKVVCILIVPLYAYKFYTLLVLGFGLTGNIFDESDIFLRWTQLIPDALSGIVTFAFFYYKKPHPIFKITKFIFPLTILNSLILTSKGVFLTMLLSYFLVISLSGQKFSNKFFRNAVIIIIITIIWFFPLINWLRTAIILDEFSIASYFSSYFSNLSLTIFQFLGRVNLFEPTTLWLTTPVDQIPSNAGIFSELIQLINRLAIGDIITQETPVDLSKLMVQLGRGYGTLNEQGGGGENVGFYATLWLYFGYFGFLYIFVWVLIWMYIERSKIHVLHKVVLIGTYVAAPLYGDFVLVMNGSLYWYLMFTTFTVFFIRLSSFFNVKKKNTLRV